MSSADDKGLVVRIQGLGDEGYAATTCFLFVLCGFKLY